MNLLLLLLDYVDCYYSSNELMFDLLMMKIFHMKSINQIEANDHIVYVYSHRSMYLLLVIIDKIFVHVLYDHVHHCWLLYPDVIPVHDYDIRLLFVQSIHKWRKMIFHFRKIITPFTYRWSWITTQYCIIINGFFIIMIMENFIDKHFDFWLLKSCCRCRGGCCIGMKINGNWIWFLFFFWFI